MKKIYPLLFSLAVLLCSNNVFAQNRYWVGVIIGNWNSSLNWSTTSGGIGGATVPAAGNVAIFNSSANGNCQLDISPTVGGIIVNGYTGTISLTSYDLTTTGTSTFTTGTISSTTGSLILNTGSGVVTTFNGTTIGPNVTGTSGRIYFSGSTFNGTVNVTKSDTNTETGTGGNTFNAATILTVTGTGALELGSSSADIFQSTLTLNINSTGSISLAKTSSGNQFNGNVSINYNSTGNIYFGASNGTSSLANTKTISVASYSASGCGNLSLGYFTQTGATAQTITLAGNNTAKLTVGPSTAFNGNLTATSPDLSFQTSTFAGTTQVTKTGNTESDMRGGNIFNGTTTINNQGADLVFGHTSSDPGDTFNADVTFNNTGGNRIRVPEQSAGTVFNGTVNFNCTSSTDVNNRIQVSRLSGGQATFNGAVYFNNAGNGSDIHISYDAGSSTTFNGPVYFTSAATNGAEYFIGVDGNVIFTSDIQFSNTTSDAIYISDGSGTVTFGSGAMSIGAGGFATGELRLQNFTQTGSTAQTLTLTGTAALRLGPSSTFNGAVTFKTPQLYLNGATYNGTTYIEKTGSTINTGTGSNTFNGVTTLVNSGANSFYSGNTTNDVFNNDLTLTNTGAASIYMADNSLNNTFNGNITLNNTSSGGIYFCNTGGSASLATGKTISVGGTGFTNGELRLIRFTQVGSTAQSLTLAGTASLKLGPSSIFNASVSFVTPQIYLNGCTFNGTTSIEKNGATSNTGTGSNIFNGITTLINSGSGQLITGNTTTDAFNNDITLTNSGSSSISMADNSTGNVFGGNITLNCTSGGGIYFANNAGATASLATGKTISIGGSGFTTGELRLYRFTQTGSTAQSFTLTGTAALKLGPSSQFNGNVNFVSPQVYLNGVTFAGTAYIEKNGATDNTSTGGNTFNGVTTLVNSSSASFEMASTSPDTYSSTLTVTNSGTNRTQLGLSSAGNVYNGDVTLNFSGANVSGNNFIVARNSGCTATFNGALNINCNNTSTTTAMYIGYDGAVTINGNVTVSCTNGGGVYFGKNNGSAALSNGYSVSAGTFTTGTLQFKSFTQTGSTAQNVTLTGSANLTLGPSATFNGNVNFVAPTLLLSGATYNGTTYLEKNGSTNDTSGGNNTFNGSTTIVDSGSGSLISANSTLDTFNGPLTLTNTGSNAIYMAYTVSGTVFNDNITVNSSAGSGVTFGYNGGSATLASGKTITIGGSGFSIGDLRLARFTQSGSTAQSLTMTGTSRLILGPSSQFNGSINFVSPQILLNGTTFNGTAYIEKNGATNNSGSGGNIFNSTATIVNSSAGYLLMANTTADTFNGPVTLTNTGSSLIYAAHNSSGTVFNGNIAVNSTSGSGIYFANGSSGDATLASGATINVGATGFTTGELRLSKFTQLGSTAQAITLTGTGIIRMGPSTTFNGAATVTAPQLFLDGTTFNSTATIQKNGASNNDSAGGNVFNGTTTITNSGTARLRLAGTTADSFSGDATFVRSSTGTYDLAYAQTNSFAGNITFNSSSGITVGGGGGTVQLTGSNSQSINKTGGSASPTIPILSVSKTSGTITLNTDVTIGTSATLTTGIINSTSTNYLNFADNASVSGANDASYVDGPVRKTGNDAFTFPIGNSNFYSPIAISAPSNTAHHFTAQYFKSKQTYGGPATWDPSFSTISGCDYWVLDRTNGTSNVFVTLSWNTAICGSGYVGTLTDLRVAHFNTASSTWTNEGNGSTTGSSSSGTVTTSAAVTSFSPFAIGSENSTNPLPIELGDFSAIDHGNAVQLNWFTYSEDNNEGFSIQRSSNGFEFATIAEQKGAGTSREKIHYNYLDGEPLDGISYYRLKQHDFDGKESFSKIISIQRKGAAIYFAYPNPAGDEVVTFNQRSNIVIINSLNEPIMTMNETSNFDASRLTAGVYFIRNQNGQVIKVVKK